MLLFYRPDLMLKMLIIFTVRPVAAPGKSMGDKEFVTEIAGTEFMWKITIPVGICFGTGWRNPDLHVAVRRGAWRIDKRIGSGVLRSIGISSIFPDIGDIGVKEGVDVNCHSERVAG